MPFWGERVEGRHALGHAIWDDYVPDRAERAMWYRFDEPPFLDDGSLDPLALVVLADTMPGAVGEKLGRQERFWFAPSVDLTVHLLDACRSPWVPRRLRDPAVPVHVLRLSGRRPVSFRFCWGQNGHGHRCAPRGAP